MPPAPQAPRKRSGARTPPTPSSLGPGRGPLGKRQRTIVAVTLGIALVIAIVVGVLLATGRSGSPPKAVTIPEADRDAPASLVQAAERVGYRPPSLSGVGSIESAPAEAAGTPANDKLLPIGSVAPPWTLKTPAGKTYSLKDFRGKALLIEFFATWCPHCAAEASHLADISRNMPADKVAVVGINADNESAATVFAYHVYFGLPFPALLDPSPNTTQVDYPQHGPPGPTSVAYQAAYYPTFYIVDPQGRIAWRSDGEQPDALLVQELEKAAGG
jgi:peroxiredoxin